LIGTFHEDRQRKRLRFVPPSEPDGASFAAWHVTAFDPFR
jgi:hypothetical protein